MSASSPLKRIPAAEVVKPNCGKGFRLELDFVPPTTNQLYVFNPTTRRRFPSVYLTTFQHKMRVALMASDVQALPLGPYRLSYRVNINRKSDIDNRIKALTDSLVEAGLIPDDRNCDDLRIQRDCTISGCVIEAEALHG